MDNNSNFPSMDENENNNDNNSLLANTSNDEPKSAPVITESIVIKEQKVNDTPINLEVQKDVQSLSSDENVLSDKVVVTSTEKMPKLKRSEGGSNKGIILIVLVVIAVAAFFIMKKTGIGGTITIGGFSFTINGNKNNTDVEDDILKEIKTNIIGVWQNNSETTPVDNTYYIRNVSITFNEDNTFTIEGESKTKYVDGTDGSNVIVQGGGTYSIDNSGIKITLNYDDNTGESSALYKGENDFSMVSNEITIGSESFKKVSNKTNFKKEVDSEIVGKWYWFANNIKDKSIYYVFNSDGTAEYNVKGNKLVLTYETYDNKILLNNGGLKKENSYSIKSDTLIINDGVVDNTYIKEQ